MGGWQDWAVALLLAGCIWRIGKKFWDFFRRIGDEKSNPCEGCLSDCKLRELHEARRCDCHKMPKKKKKSCCG